MSKIIYKFGGKINEGGAEDKKLLGGKGANLAEMAKLGLPVPPGLTITTEMCVAFEDAADKLEFIDGIMEQVLPALDELEQHFGYMPLLSVRSGAPVSMPGMMDTILNVGLTTDNLPEWADRIGERAALDSYRRLIQMFGSVVFEIPMEEFEHELEQAKMEAGVDSDADLTDEDLRKLVKSYAAVISMNGYQWPNTLADQVAAATMAVFQSWGNERAIIYRELNNIPSDMGTAVNIQTMVFGNMNDESCSGVLFTRNPSTGEPGLMGEFLPNAQGEDVVAGIRTPIELGKMGVWNEKVYAQLYKLAMGMEEHANDMQDMEFTVQNGELFILQTRNGKRSAKAAIRIAMDLLKEGKIDKATALSRVSYKQFLLAQQPVIDPAFKDAPLATGIAAGGGVVTGQAVFSSDAAVAMAGDVNVILVAKETTPDDIAGMNASVGILTSTGGATSHAAVVARGMDKSCVVGCTDMVIGSMATVGETTFKEGDEISIDGSTGRVWKGKVPTISATEDPAFAEFQKLVLKRKKFMHVMAIESMEELSGWYMAYLRSEATAVDADLLDAALTKVAKYPDYVKVVLDLRGPAALRDETDAGLWGLFGEEPVSTDTEAVNAVLAKHAKLSARVVLIAPEGIGSEGWGEVKTVESIAELLDASGPIVYGKGLIEVAGGKSSLKKLLGMLKKGGGKFEEFLMAKTRDELLVDALA